MTVSIFRKIWCDLAQRPGRSVLTLVGLVVGLWGVGSVTVAWWVLGQDMSENFLGTNPPSIAVTVDGSASIDLDALRDIEGVTGLSLRPQIKGRIEIAPETWLPMVLWVVEDFGAMEVAKVFLETGPLLPAPGGFMMERDGLAFGNFLRARATGSDPLGRLEDSELTVALPGGKTVTATLEGTVFDPAQAPSRMEQAFYGYITPDTARGWTGGAYNQRVLVSTDASHDKVTLTTIAAALEARLNELGYAVLATRYPSATEHVHQFQMNAILFLLTGLGTLALLMGVVLVLNLVNGLLTSQVRQIGVLKAIGGSTRQVMLIYLGAMGSLGLAAGLLAWPLVLKTGYGVAQGLSAFLNFEVLTLQLPGVFAPAFLLLGSLFPVVAALAPVHRWCSLPVTDALRYSGVTLTSKTGPNLPLPVVAQMGLRNAFRKPARTFLTAATLALGVTIFMAALNMRSSLLYTATLEESLKGFDVVVSFEEPIAPGRVAFMDRFGMVARAETWRVLGATIAADSTANPLPLYLVPADSSLLRPILLDGVWLAAGDSMGVVINQRLQNDYPALGVGGTVDVDVGGRRLTLPVTGVMKEFGGAAIYMNAAAYRSLAPETGGLINTAFVGLKEPNERNLSTLMRKLESHFPLAGVTVRGMRSAKIASRVIRGHLDVIVTTLLLVAVFMLMVSSLGIASAIATTVVERTRELGVLRAIGGTPRAIYGLLASESLVIALLGWSSALVIAQPVSRALSAYFGTALVEYPFDYQGSLPGVGLSLLLTLLLAGISSFAPARLANRQSIREAVSYE